MDWISRLSWSAQAVHSLLLLAVLLISHPKEQRHDWRPPIVGGIPDIGSA